MSDRLCVIECCYSLVPQPGYTKNNLLTQNTQHDHANPLPLQWYASPHHSSLQDHQLSASNQCHADAFEVDDVVVKEEEIQVVFDGDDILASRLMETSAAQHEFLAIDRKFSHRSSDSKKCSASSRNSSAGKYGSKRVPNKQPPISTCVALHSSMLTDAQVSSALPSPSEAARSELKPVSSRDKVQQESRAISSFSSKTRVPELNAAVLSNDLSPQSLEKPLGSGRALLHRSRKNPSKQRPVEISATIRDRKMASSSSRKANDRSILCGVSSKPNCRPATLARDRFVGNLENMDMHHEGRENVCEIQQTLLGGHTRLVKGVQLPHACELCGESFCRKTQLKTHMRIHAVEKPYTCPICSKSFMQIGTLTNHIKRHTDETPTMCPICCKTFTNKADLDAHMRHHTNTSCYVCGLCHMVFTQKVELDKHTRLHSVEKRYPCELCSKSFHAKTHLETHMRIHSGDKPYSCEICSTKFTQKSHLDNHTRRHTGDKPYVCKFCGRAFVQKTQVDNHTRLHTGEKPFVCNSCGKAFCQQSQLNFHARIHYNCSKIVVKTEKKYSGSVLKRSSRRNMP